MSEDLEYEVTGLVGRNETECKYYTFKDDLGIQSTFHVLHMNVRSIKNKFDDIRNIFTNSSVQWDVVCLSETWLKDDIVKYYSIDGYNMYASCRSETEGGGTLIYVNEKYEVKERSDLECSKIEARFVQIQVQHLTGHKHIVVGVLYRPPNYNNKTFLEYLEQLLETIENEKKFSILAGDFNYNLLEGQINNAAQLFINLLNSYSFLPMISKPTRVQKQHESLLDNIFVNNSNFHCRSGIILDDLSDHLPIFSSFSLSDTYSSDRKTVKVFNKTKLHELRCFLANALDDFQNHTDAQAACSKILSSYDEGINKFSKILKQSRRKTPINPWLTPALLCSINTKNKLYKKFLKHRNMYHETKYKKYRNMLVKLIRDAKTLFFRKSFEDNKNNGKETWQLLNLAINKKKK